MEKVPEKWSRLEHVQVATLKHLFEALGVFICAKSLDDPAVHKQIADIHELSARLIVNVPEEVREARARSWKEKDGLPPLA